MIPLLSQNVLVFLRRLMTEEVYEGDIVECPVCDGEHELVQQGDMLYYQCGEDFYLFGIKNKKLTGSLWLKSY